MFAYLRSTFGGIFGSFDDRFASLSISSPIGHMTMYTLFCVNVALNIGYGVFYVKLLATLMPLFFPLTLLSLVIGWSPT